MNHIRGICFDLFSTLVNVGDVPLAVGAYTADILGVAQEQWQAACFGPEHDICGPTDAFDTLKKLAHAIDPTIPLQKITAAVAARQRRFDHALRHVPQQTLDDLQQLRQAGLRLGLISNASTAEVAAWRESPLAGLFDSVVFSCECGMAKPQAGIYQHALTQLALTASECLFVGDGGSEEHRGAHALGLSPLLLTTYPDDRQIRQRRQQYAGMLHCEVASISELVSMLTSSAA